MNISERFSQGNLARAIYFVKALERAVKFEL